MKRGGDGLPEFDRSRPEIVHRISINPSPGEEIFIKPGFKEVEMVFNIGRIEGMPQRGNDMVNADGQRRYFVRESDRTSEDMVRQELGQKAVLKFLGKEGGLLVYDVPLGAQPLVKVLEIAQYRREYMDRLESESEEFLQKLSGIDSNRFGADINTLALAQNGGEDDTYLTLIPPLLPPRG